MLKLTCSDEAEVKNLTGIDTKPKEMVPESTARAGMAAMLAEGAPIEEKFGQDWLEERGRGAAGGLAPHARGPLRRPPAAGAARALRPAHRVFRPAEELRGAARPEPQAARQAAGG